MKLINGDINISDHVDTFICDCSEYGRQEVMCVDSFADLPEVDPEMLPVVQELREENDKLHLAMENISEVLQIAHKQRDGLKKRLKRVTAERDKKVFDSEYIRKQDVLDLLERISAQDCNMATISEKVQSISTIEVRPVVHGEWIEVERTNIWDEKTKVLQCSNCGKFKVKTHGITVKSDFCPNCNRDMRTEK